MRLLYPLARIGRGALVGQAVHACTDSVPLALCAFLGTDAVSILLDARPFFKTWSQFWLAAACLPWFFDTYWSFFVARADPKLYGLEVLLVYSLLFLGFPLLGDFA